MNVAGRDADAAAAVRFLAGAGRDEAGAVRADEPGLRALHRVLHAHHVIDRDALGDGDDEVEPGIHAFQDGVGGERRRDENRADGRAGFARGFGDGVEDRHLMRAVFKDLAALSRRDAGDELRAVVERELRVARAEVAGDALDEDAGGGCDEDGHLGKSDG